MRKVVAIFFLSIFLINIIGYYPVFLLRQQTIKNELKHIINQNIASGILTVLSFDKNQLRSVQWLKLNEFSYKGDLYDIVMTESGDNGKIYYYCVIDKKEKHLLAQLEKHVSNNIADNDKNQKTKHNFLKNSVKDFILLKKEFFEANNSTMHDFKPIILDYTSNIPNKLTPPPKSI